MDQKIKDYSFEILEMDRKRIARDLHDTSLQSLTHLVHKLELASLYMDKDLFKAKVEIELVNRKINEIIDEIRDIIFDLRPMTFDDLGLKGAIEELIDKIKFHCDMEITQELEDVYEMEESTALTLYRVVQESICNAKKHAQADKLIIQLKNLDEKVYLSVIDNGVGFNTNDIIEKKKHFGIQIMKERVEMSKGSFTIETGKQKGTKIIVSVPKK